MSSETESKPSASDPVIHDAVKSSIVIGGAKKSSRAIIAGVFVAVLLVVIGIGGVVLYQKNNTPPVKIDTKKNVTEQVRALTPKEAAKVASQTVDAKKDPQTAYVKAVAQAETGDAKASVTTFEAVVVATPAPKIKYYVYYDYAIAAAKAGNLKLAQEQMQNAIDAIQADSKVSSNVKTSETDNMEQKLQFFKLEAQ